MGLELLAVCFISGALVFSVDRVVTPKVMERYEKRVDDNLANENIFLSISKEFKK